jgi:hypothetical protein
MNADHEYHIIFLYPSSNKRHLEYFQRAKKSVFGLKDHQYHVYGSLILDSFDAEFFSYQNI